MEQDEAIFTRTGTASITIPGRAFCDASLTRREAEVYGL